MFQRSKEGTERSRSAENRLSPDQRRPNGHGGSPDIRGLTDLLYREFESGRQTVEKPDRTDPALVGSIRKAVKIGLAAGLAIALGWKPLLATLTTSSAEAFVNTTVVTLRSPIDGNVDALFAQKRVGAKVVTGEKLFRISEPLTDRVRELDINRSLNRANREKQVLSKRIALLTTLKADLDKQANAFRVNRMRQLEERIGEVDEKIGAAVAVQREASVGVQRNKRLDTAGLARDGGLARSIRDEAVAAGGVGELRHQAAAMQVELNALKENQFVGDSFNDRPQSAQRSEQLQQSIADLTIELDAKAAEVAELTEELAAEKDRIGRLSMAAITAPKSGVVWELLTSPGERVSRGQDLIRLLDCSQAVVSAAVEEGVYNRIRVGDAVSFRLRGESIDRAGTIVRLSGLAAAPANLAISPSTLLKAPYRAAISVPSLGEDGVCDIGRTGKVTFEASPSGATPTPTPTSTPSSP